MGQLRRRCTGDFAPCTPMSWLASHGASIDLDWVASVVRAPLSEATMREVLARKTQLVLKLPETVSLTNQQFGAMIAGEFQQVSVGKRPKLKPGVYAGSLVNSDPKIAAGGGGTVWPITAYKPTRDGPPITYNGHQLTDLVMKDEVASNMDPKNIRNVVHETHMQRNLRLLLQSTDRADPPRIQDLVLPAWLILGKTIYGKPVRRLLGPVMPYLPKTIWKCTKEGLYGLPREPPVDDKSQVAAATRPLSRRRIGEIAQQLFLFLAIAHRAGISHNDIKSDNILSLFGAHGSDGWPRHLAKWPWFNPEAERNLGMGREDTIGMAIREVHLHGVNIAVIDFGTAAPRRLSRRAGDGGTAQYLPPALLGMLVLDEVDEEDGAAETGETADVWAACAVVGSMLWGTEPRQATDARGGWPFVHVQNQRARRRSAREATGEPPRTLEELVHRCLIPDAARRPSALQVLEWLTTRGPTPFWETSKSVRAWRAGRTDPPRPHELGGRVRHAPLHRTGGLAPNKALIARILADKAAHQEARSPRHPRRQTGYTVEAQRHIDAWLARHSR